MKALGRFFVCIWAIIFLILAICGGFILFPVIRYIFTGQFDDPMEVTIMVYCSGKDMIENIFSIPCCIYKNSKHD